MSAKKITVSVCAGTTCYLMGGGDLLAMEWPEELRERIVFQGSPCLGCCREPDRKPPFARVGDRIYDRVNPDTLLRATRQALGEGADDESRE